jgi:uncharacterized membrane protein
MSEHDGSVDPTAELSSLQLRVSNAEAAVAALTAELHSLQAALNSARSGSSRMAAAPLPGIRADEQASVAVSQPMAAPPVGVPAFATAANAPKPPQDEPKQSLENKIGSQWFARIGILALLLGVAGVLKLAIDNHWIHPTPLSKTIAGLLLGAGVVLWSEHLRRKGYAAFSYSLKAVGTGVLYLTLWAAFHLWGLLPAPVALVLMIGVTAWNATMAWLQDAELLAAYALVGAFLSPALLGQGGNHEVFLFTYIFAIDAAVLWLLTRKPWQRLLLGSFPATALYFTGWYSEWFTKEAAAVTTLFVLLLSAPFVAVALAGRQRDDAGEGVLTPLAAASFLSLALYSVLQDSGRHAWEPWVAVLLAGLYLLLQRARRGVVAEATHLAIAIVLLSVAVPLKLSGNALVIAWLVEGVVLLWVAGWIGERAQPSVARVLHWLGGTAIALGITGAFITSFDTANRVIVNRRFLVELCGVAAALARDAGQAVQRRLCAGAGGPPAGAVGRCARDTVLLPQRGRRQPG